MNKRRLAKARQAVLHKQGRAQQRALLRIGLMAGDVAWYDAWLSTHPAPEQVDAVLNAYLRSPLRRIVPPAREVQ